MLQEEKYPFITIDMLKECEFIPPPMKSFLEFSVDLTVVL